MTGNFVVENEVLHVLGLKLPRLSTDRRKSQDNSLPRLALLYICPGRTGGARSRGRSHDNLGLQWNRDLRSAPGAGRGPGQRGQARQPERPDQVGLGLMARWAAPC